MHVPLLCLLEVFCKIHDSKTHDSTAAAIFECCVPAKEVVLVDCLVHKPQQMVISICIACMTAALNL